MTDTTQDTMPDTVPTGTTTLSINTLYAEYLRREAEERAAEREDLATLRPHLLALAREAGATQITASYEGGGDSGVVDRLFAEPEAADTALKAVTVMRPDNRWNRATSVYERIEHPVPFFDAVRDMMTMMLTHAVGNWWDGNIETSGDIDWHIAEDRVSGEHNEVRRESDYTAWGDDVDDESSEDNDPTAGPAGERTASSSEG